MGFDWIFDAFQDKDGMIWFASMGNGLWKHDPGKNSFKSILMRKVRRIHWDPILSVR